MLVMLSGEQHGRHAVVWLELKPGVTGERKKAPEKMGSEFLSIGGPGGKRDGSQKGQAQETYIPTVSLGKVLFRDRQEASDEDYTTSLLTGQNFKLLCAALMPFVFPLCTVKA